MTEDFVSRRRMSTLCRKQETWHEVSLDSFPKPEPLEKLPFLMERSIMTELSYRPKTEVFQNIQTNIPFKSKFNADNY